MLYLTCFYHLLKIVVKYGLMSSKPIIIFFNYLLINSIGTQYDIFGFSAVHLFN
jgi:hypothetical protein